MTAGRRINDPLDRYDTPPGVTSRFLRAWTPRLPQLEDKPAIFHVREPAAGAGAMLGPLSLAFPLADISARDVEPRMEGVLRSDFLEETDDPEAELIFTNPPFRLAEQFVRQAHRLSRSGTYIVFLLRAGFLESARRRDLFEQYPPIEAWFLRQRPRFAGPNVEPGTTDAAMYVWLVWKNGERPEYFEGRWV